MEHPEPQIPPRPVMPPEAAAYPRLKKIDAELNRQNRIIFDAEHERGMLEIERDDLRGLARLTKKKELDSKIDRKNEEIDILKAGLSGIVKQYGFATVQDFYTVLHTAQNAFYRYQQECTKWDESYGEKATSKVETMHEKIQRYKEKANSQNALHPYRSKDKGAVALNICAQLLFCTKNQQPGFEKSGCWCKINV